MPSTARGEVRSHINYFSPHSPVPGLSTPYHTSQPLTHTNGIGNGLETNLSFSFPPYSLPYKSLSLSLVSLSLRIFPNFVSVLLSLSLTPPSHPYALREIDFSTESPLPALPTRGTKELQCFCNVFHIVHASRNYYCIKKPSATSR